LRAAGDRGRVFDLFGHFVTGLQAVQTRVVVLETFEFVVGRFQAFVRNQQHMGALLQFDLGDFWTLFVQQE